MLVFPGIQAYIYLAQFCRQRTKGNAFRKCPYTWNGLCHAAINRVHCNAGMPSHSCTFIRIHQPSIYRLGSPSAHHQSSPGQTLPPIRKGSTTLSSTCWKTLMSKKRSVTLLRGGIGQLIILLCKHILTPI